jgi:hypothetical protein
MGYMDAYGCGPPWPTALNVYLAHKSYSLLGLAVSGPFMAKTAVQNTNLGIILVNRTKVR